MLKLWLGLAMGRDWYGKDIDWYYRHVLVISIWGFVHFSNIWAKVRGVLGFIDWFARPAQSLYSPSLCTLASRFLPIAFVMLLYPRSVELAIRLPVPGIGNARAVSS